MNLYWIYDFPNWLMGVFIVAVFNVVAIGGFYLTRPLTKWILGGSDRHNDIVSFFFAGVGVFYGLALGLMKDSSLVLWIGVIELLRSSQIVVTRTQQPLLVLAIAGAIYFAISFPIARAGSWLERRWQDQ